MAAATRVKIQGTSGLFEQQVTAGSHQFSVDEPEEFGGTDKGPTPYEYLLSALGSCVAITVRMYANKKDWKLDDVEVELTHHKVHAKDCEDCEQTKGYVDIIEKSVKLIGDLTDEQKARLTEIAGRCPVHRTLENGVKIR